MYGPGPYIPATGGFALSAAGLIYGSIVGDGIIIGVSVILVLLIVGSLIRLKIGEHKIAKRDK